jgi:hemerythrin
MVCQGNIEQLIRTFVEITLKHNMIESLYMEDGVPSAHRIAHNQAHLAMAEQMKSIRVVLSEDRNCVLAIEGIDQVLETLKRRFEEYDQLLESYLLMAA